MQFSFEIQSDAGLVAIYRGTLNRQELTPIIFNYLVKVKFLYFVALIQRMLDRVVYQTEPKYNIPDGLLNFFTLQSRSKLLD